MLNLTNNESLDLVQISLNDFFIEWYQHLKNIYLKLKVEMIFAYLKKFLNEVLKAI